MIVVFPIAILIWLIRPLYRIYSYFLENSGRAVTISFCQSDKTFIKTRELRKRSVSPIAEPLSFSIHA